MSAIVRPTKKVGDARAVGWVVGSLVCIALIAGRSAYAEDRSGPAWRAAHQLVNAQLPSGQFAFEHDFLLGGKRPDTELGFGQVAYITRQAAAAYGLSRYYLYDKEPDLARALVAVLRNFAKNSVPIDKATGQQLLESTGILTLPFGRYKLHGTLKRLGLLYRPSGEGQLVSYDRSHETAWGGATALALLTELQFYRANHDGRFASLRRAWLRGLLVLYDGVGGFRTLPDSIDENDLSNGEVWLALAYYTRLFPDDRATAAIVARVDRYLMQNYAARPNTIFYSWAMKAAAERHVAVSDPKFVEFIAQQTRTYLDSTRTPSDLGENSCADVEGLAAAYHVLNGVAHPNHNLIGRLRQRISSEMTKNLALQIQPHQTRIELGSNTYLISPSVIENAGAFLAGKHQPYVRIDYTEHCICALVELSQRP
ncbi:MAG TPA: hypothetical protein VE988_10075 [Gemmataceae bacterium]|nr:hypothetical protein [Gemmataceae bacterium]